MQRSPPCVAFVHGFAHTNVQFAPVLERVPSLRRAYRLIVPFHQAPPVASFDAALSACWRQLDAAQRAPVTLVGYSLGARLALGLALARPERVRRLISIAGHPGLTSDAERRTRRAADARWQQLLRQHGTAAFLREFRAQPLFGPGEGRARGTGAPTVDRGAAGRMQAREQLGAHALADAFDVLGLAAMPNYRPLLSELCMPVHFVVGEHDGKFARLAQEASEACAHATVSVAPGAYHDVVADAPAWLAAQLSAWLAAAAEAQFGPAAGVQ